MRMHLAVVTAFAVFILMPAAASASEKFCGNYEYGVGWTYGEVSGASITNVHASQKLTCRVARRVSKNALRNYRGTRTWVYRGYWNCRMLVEGYEYYKVRCRTPKGSRVTWETGS